MKTANQLAVHIRWLIRRDMQTVLRIESESFDFPWCEDDFIRELRIRTVIAMAAEHGEQVVGYMLYELHKTKLRLLNLAVSPDVRRRGVGSAMVNKLVGKLSPDRRNRITVQVRETNLDGCLFFKALGFEATGIVSSPYEETAEDGIAFCRRLAREVVK